MRCTRGGEQQAPLKPSGRQAPPTPLNAPSRLASEPGIVLSDRGAEPLAESPAQDREQTGVEVQRADLSALAHDQAGFLGSGPKPPVMSPEMFHFFATAIRQHRQARNRQEVSLVRQEVSQEKEVRSCLSSLYPT